MTKQTLIGRQTIRLGSAVKDKLTGFSGIATAVTVWLTGCTRYAVQPRKLDKGKVQDPIWFDQDQLEVIGHGVNIEIATPGGPPCRGRETG
jgi:hypothetical protein